MLKGLLSVVGIAILTLLPVGAFADCKGHFVNPITDVCWECLMPISIGNVPVVSGGAADTKNPASPIEVCKMPVGYRVGLNIGFWEPFALADVTPTPYCLVNLGGIKMSITHVGVGGKKEHTPESSSSFYYVHWYKYPLVYWLQLITSTACMQTGEFDIGYLTELDPTWDDSQLAYILNPEAVLFSSKVAQAACAADAVAANTHLPLDKLFWCAGTQGGMYPLDGHVLVEKSPIQAALLLSERLDYKMHREGMVWDSIGDSGHVIDGPICHQYLTPILPKSRYRYQMTNTVAAANGCYPFGHAAATWEAGHNYPSEGNQFGFLIWKKRNCTFL